MVLGDDGRSSTNPDTSRNEPDKNNSPPHPNDGHSPRGKGTLQNGPTCTKSKDEQAWVQPVIDMVENLEFLSLTYLKTPENTRVSPVPTVLKPCSQCGFPA